MKKILFLSLLFLFVIILSDGSGYAEVPRFSAGQSLTFSDGTELMPASPNGIAVPCMVDWNGDGSRDLLVGYFGGGPVYLFPNASSNGQPIFNRGDEVRLQADGEFISVAYG